MPYVTQGLHLTFLAIPCSRHDTGEDDPRVRVFLGLALGMISSFTEDFKEKYLKFLQSVVRFHDHKGQLIIVSKEKIPEWIEGSWSEIWNTLDSWPVAIDQISFDDPSWEDIWSSRRFKSDWRPQAMI